MKLNNPRPMPKSRLIMKLNKLRPMPKNRLTMKLNKICFDHFSFIDFTCLSTYGTVSSSAIWFTLTFFIIFAIQSL